MSRCKTYRHPQLFGISEQLPPLKLIIFENMFNVLAYIGFARGVKLAELLLGEPSGFA